MDRRTRQSARSSRDPSFHGESIGTTNPGHNYHLLSNFEIDVDGDTATAWSRWAFVVPGPDKKPVMAQGGHYDDTLVRENGRRRFKRRTASTDLPSSGPRKPYFRGPFRPRCCRLWILGHYAGLWLGYWLVDFDSRSRSCINLSRLTDVLDGRSGRNSPSSKALALPRWLL